MGKKKVTKKATGQQRMRNTPRMSVNELAKYLHASTPAARRKIVKQQKYPPEYMTVYYDDASSTICKFLSGGMKDEDIIVSKIDKLYATNPKNRPDETKLPYNAEVLEAFLDSYDLLDLGKCRLKEGNNKGPKDNFSGVDISIRPEFLIMGTIQNQKVVGALKLFISKTLTLNDDSGSVISTLLWNHVQKNYEKSGKPLHSICYTWDVCGQKLYQAPKSTKRRLSEIEAACEEIALRWGNI